MDLVRAARGGKSKRGGTSTIGGGGSLFIQSPIQLHISASLFFKFYLFAMLGFPKRPLKMEMEWVSVMKSEDWKKEPQCSEFSPAPRISPELDDDFNFPNPTLVTWHLEYMVLGLGEQFETLVILTRQ